MPAIDPDRLARQLADLAPLASDPSALATAVIKLADEYVDRTARRPAEESGLPGPVHRAVLHALQLALKNEPEAAARAAEGLWRKAPIAAKLLAAGLLGSYPDGFAADLAQDWAADTVLGEVIRQLGEVGLTTWRRTHPSEFLERAEDWLAGRPRLLALYALRAAVQESEFEDLPAVFRLLDGVGGRVRGESKRVFTRLIEALAIRSASETAQFVLGQVASGGSGTAWMRALLSDRASRSPP